MSQSIPVLRRLAELRAQVQAWRRQGAAVALIPTMGALHQGHLELVRLARTRAERVVVSIFVNPAQFAPNEDFDRYPRDEAGDLRKLLDVGVDLVWSPERTVMYPDGFATRIVPEGAALGLESEFRPHFFGGVATVCCKLFTQVAPDIAVFGEKDFQQLAVVRQLVRDLNLPLDIVGAPTVREADGLAMSSRNAYLSEEQRRIAPAIHRAIVQVAHAVREGMDANAACAEASRTLLAQGFAKVDYIAVRDAGTLAPAKPGAPPAGLRVLAAAWLGKTRLIDNIAV